MDLIEDNTWKEVIEMADSLRLQNATPDDPETPEEEKRSNGSWIWWCPKSYTSIVLCS